MGAKVIKSWEFKYDGLLGPSVSPGKKKDCRFEKSSF